MPEATQPDAPAPHTDSRRLPAGEPTPAAPSATHRAGFVAILGRPNVGKSTLLNVLLGEKLAITSPRPQTTRHRLLGILTGDGYQVGFWDTPGFMKTARDPLDRRMRGRIREALDASGLAVMVVPPHPPGAVETALMSLLRAAGTPAILAINKIDRVQKEALLPVMEAYIKEALFVEVVPISALRQDGTATLLKLMVSRLPPGEAQFASDDLTDRSERFLAAELVREQLFRLYGQEVPYDTAVEVEGFHEADGVARRKDLIEVVIHVNRPSQRRILIGQGGMALKEVGTAARQEIESLLGREVFLHLWVHVREGWREDEGFLEEMGY